MKFEQRQHEKLEKFLKSQTHFKKGKGQLLYIENRAQVFNMVYNTTAPLKLFFQNDKKGKNISRKFFTITLMVITANSN